MRLVMGYVMCFLIGTVWSLSRLASIALSDYAKHHHTSTDMWPWALTISWAVLSFALVNTSGSAATEKT